MRAGWTSRTESRRGIVLASLAACVAALLCGHQAQAQGYRQLPDASQAIQIKPPGSEQLFRVESEASLRQRMVEEARGKNAPTPFFPAAPPAVEPVFTGRAWPCRVTYVEPSYVCYGRLLFEQINSERYGWDLGPLHPAISLGIFYLDVAMLPYHLATDPCRCHECSAGYCLPGDPMPLLFYPPECSVTGALAEVATIGALIALFP